MKIALVAAFIISLLMAFFAAQNSQHTQVTFLGWYFDGPLVIILLVTFGIGVLAAFLATLPGSVRKTIEIKKLKSRLSECSAKLEVYDKKEADALMQSEPGTAQQDKPQGV